MMTIILNVIICVAILCGGWMLRGEKDKVEVKKIEAEVKKIKAELILTRLDYMAYIKTIREHLEEVERTIIRENEKEG